MGHKKVKLTALLLGLGLTGLSAQEAIPATGGNALGSGGSVSYSVGQVVYTTNTGTNGSMAQGVQQPYEILVVTALEDAKEINLNLTTYPNPTTNLLNLKVGNYSSENLTYQLYDITGKLLLNQKVIGSETSIMMGNLTDATYFLKVTADNKEVKTFKIIKN